MVQSGCTSDRELKLHTLGYKIVAGVDEAGRGALAGPVVAACVAPGKGFSIDGIRDSKKLTPARREQLFELIVSEASAVGIGMVEADEIDRTNILKAALLAMRKAYEECRPSPDYLLIDGDRGFNTSVQMETIIGGDDLSISIAAASIVAKVTRDRIMVKLAADFPEYGFELHKGYGTKSHFKAISEYGPSSIHRMSFSPMCNSKQGELFEGARG